MTTVREFAERVLFADSLADKLAPPAPDLEDLSRGPALAAPRVPGRPDGLALSDSGVRAGFPSLARVEDDRERGRLLHFFANHELLATELMALVLLKFPDAPDEFRAGVLRTLKEEQMHTKLYLRRMESCGVEFGELPVNGFFWKLVAPMATPLDYVTRLSLTFEQANLDYSRGYARVFDEAGDPDTAAILDRIYRDEIGHVHYGLEWFRKWRRGSSDWKSFCSLLGAPLSPARAKGSFEFNEAGRREAGLDEEFIRELKAFSRSRGRTPRVHWFNPGAEDSLAGRPPGRAMNRVRRDLDLLMAFVARGDDVALVDELPSTGHLLSLKEAGLEMPELVPRRSAGSLSERKLGGARPWAATGPESGLAAEMGFRLELTQPRLFSKVEHAGLLRRVLAEGGWSMLADPSVAGRPVATAAEAAAWADGEGEWVVKAEFATAGRERLRFRAGDPVEAGFLETGAGVLEPWLDRVLDLSIQYDRLDDGRLVRRGFVVLENTRGGQFRRARVTTRVTDFLSPGDRRRVFEGGGSRGHLAAWLEDVFEPLLNDWLGEHRGPLGVDAMFFRDAAGELRFRPVVEVNPRFTMGRVAVELDRFAPRPGTTALTILPISAPAPQGALKLTETSPSTAFVAYRTETS
ncbi:DUF455 family protein [Haloferula sp. A504]|uniref:DUF455 family protein n=1 Tax=Haloferula sp. A504 TaxID=3373601 RepID=UPI0031C64744|nr:ferritin-like domain-containing protein [Verrucomicrobiaceae bacterium E54]